MAVNPFLSTAQLYDPSRQSGDDSGAMSGLLAKGITQQFGDPGVGSTFGSTFVSPSVSFSNIDSNNKGDDGPAINEFTGDFFSLTPGKPVDRTVSQEPTSIVDPVYGQTSTDTGSAEGFNWGGLIGGMLGAMIPVPGGAMLGYKAGTMLADALDDSPSLKNPGTAEPSAQPQLVGAPQAKSKAVTMSTSQASTRAQHNVRGSSYRDRGSESRGQRDGNRGFERSTDRASGGGRSF